MKKHTLVANLQAYLHFKLFRCAYCHLKGERKLHHPVNCPSQPWETFLLLGWNNRKIVFIFNMYFHEILLKETYGALKCQHTGRKAGSVKSFVLLSLLFTEWVQSRAGLARKTNIMIPACLGWHLSTRTVTSFGFWRVFGRWHRSGMTCFHLQKKVCMNPFRSNLACDK